MPAGDLRGSGVESGFSRTFQRFIMKKLMTCSAAIALASIGVYAHLSAEAQSAKAEAFQVTGTVESHIAAAKKAAGTHWGALQERVCEVATTPPPTPRAGGAGQAGGAGGAGRQAGPPPASAWHAEPAKVFDNLYFVGMTEYSAW